MIAALQALLLWLSRTFPRAKALLPKRVHRFLLLRVLRVNLVYEPMIRASPERLFLQNQALPWMAGNYRNVLFVGTASYTHHYEHLFGDEPDRYTTIDHNPAVGVWGSRQHIVAAVQDIDRHRPPGFFDAIVLNGVLFYRLTELDDYGLADHEELRKMARAFHRVLRPKGLLLVGWDRRDMTKSLHELGLLDPWFNPSDTPPWGRCRRFPGDPHAVASYERSAA